jgi:hypothetical protein
MFSRYFGARTVWTDAFPSSLRWPAVILRIACPPSAALLAFVIFERPFSAVSVNVCFSSQELHFGFASGAQSLMTLAQKRLNQPSAFPSRAHTSAEISPGVRDPSGFWGDSSQLDTLILTLPPKPDVQGHEEDREAEPAVELSGHFGWNLIPSSMVSLSWFSLDKFVVTRSAIFAKSSSIPVTNCTALSLWATQISAEGLG